MNAYVAPTGDLIIIQGSATAHDQESLLNDYAKMFEQGYALIGSVNYVGVELYDEKMRAKAKELGASAILIESEFKDTVTQTIPITTYHNNVSTTNYQGNVVYGRQGSAANYKGTATTTTPTTSTTYHNRQHDRHSIFVTFWIKRTTIFGVKTIDVSTEEREALNTNKGVKVLATVKGSPAHYADIFSGDFIMEVNGEPIYTNKELSDLLKEHKGTTVDLVIMRNGQEIKKSVKVLKEPV